MATYPVRIQCKRDTTENWNNAFGFIPLKGEIIVYDDYKTVIVTNPYGQQITRNVPGIKIGTGNGYVQDLAFVDDELRDKLMSHIEDQEMHLLLGERAFWNSKIDVMDDEEYIPVTSDTEETLIFTRDDWKHLKG